MQSNSSRPVSGYRVFGWLLRMAWRDSRRSRRRLLLFVSSITLGIAALVAIYSFNDSLKRDIDAQAAALAGADLTISARKQPSSDVLRMLDTLGDARSQQLSFASMVYFPKTKGTRLVQIRALEGNFPYYGAIETEPLSASSDFRKQKHALVDRALTLQFGVAPGDSIQVGESVFMIAGVLNKAPGQTGLAAGVAPVVYIPFGYLRETQLLKKGSRVNYSYFFKYNNPERVQSQLKAIEKTLDKEGLDAETIESQKQDTARSLEDLTSFLTLVAFVALLLGCIGVASSINVYVREKISSVAILRCLGVSSFHTFLIFLIQIVVVGLLGSAAGALLGAAVQQAVPLVLADLLPLEVQVSLSPAAIAQGVLAGLVLSVMFALLPLLSIRNVSPLLVLRASSEQRQAGRDPLKWLIYALIGGFLILFSYLQLRNWLEALYFIGGVVLAFAVLTFIAKALMWGVKRFFPASWSYLWRQGLANLFRPQNQTLVLVVSIGLGTFFIGTLILVQDVVLKRVTLSASGNQPNIVLFDIQSSQVNAVKSLTRQQGLPLIQQVPIVTVQIEEIKGKTAAQVRADTTLNIPLRAFSSEIRATYRDSLTDSERPSKGKWRGRALQNEPVYISLEERYARRLNVAIGDDMVFNVQGVRIPVKVGSFREVDWRRFQTNFRLVFPAGVLETAPQFHVLLTRAPDTRASVAFQQTLVQRFPNVSAIDLDLVLRTLDELLSKVGFIIRFMAAFSIITALIVLIASISISRYQRMRENVLIRTLGGSSRQILLINALEYFFLGAFAAATGILLSVSGSWLLAMYTFESAFSPRLLPLVALFGVVSFLTVLIGLINSISVLRSSPLEVLRKDI